jgi:sugar lactone lactonase YvrE
LAVGAEGELFAADGPYCYLLRAGQERQVAGMLFTPGCPGYVRGVAASGAGEWLVTTANGQVARWRPGAQESEILTDGYDRLYGVALAPGGDVVFAEAGTGRVLRWRSGAAEVLATGLDEPMGIAIDGDGAVYVSESAGGRVLKLVGGRSDTVIDGLGQPQGIAIRGDTLYVLDALAKTLIAHDLATGVRNMIAAELPVGAPAGITPKFLGPIGDMSGPMGPFAGLAIAADGTLYLSGDAEGSVLALREKR